MMLSFKLKRILLKLFSLLSVIRGYNILVVIIAQYLAAIFIFSPSKTLYNIVFDVHLFYIVFATICVIAAGYIINNFYDVPVDRINRPFKTRIDNYVKQSTKLKIYFALNFIAFVFGCLISWRAALFFSVYIFAIWLYSHKLKKYPVFGLLSAALLTISPFLAVFIYFKNISVSIIFYAVFLFLVVLVRELLKDLQNLKGAILNNYDTFPVIYGERKTKQLAVLLLLVTLLIIVAFTTNVTIGIMKYYFYGSFVMLFFVGIFICISSSLKHYAILHNLLKILLLIGVFWLVLIDKAILIERVLHFFC